MGMNGCSWQVINFIDCQWHSKLTLIRPAAERPLGTMIGPVCSATTTTTPFDSSVTHPPRRQPLPHPDQGAEHLHEPALPATDPACPAATCLSLPSSRLSPTLPGTQFLPQCSPPND